MRKAILLPLLAALLWGCAVPTKTPQMMAPHFDRLGVEEIALAPVVFADRPIDRYLTVRAADEIRYHAQRTLEAKGYRVVLMGNGHAYGLRQPKITESDLGRLAPPVPEGSDAVVIIRIDNFLDAGLYDRHVRSSLDIYATAALVTAEREMVWRDQGVGRGSILSSPISYVDLFQPSAYLAQSLFATLPDAR